MKVKAVVLVRPRQGVLDPAGEAVFGALRSLGYDAVQSCRIGRRVEIELIAPDLEQAHEAVQEMARRLIVNDVLEDYTFEVEAL